VAKIYRFGPYELNLGAYELRDRDRRIPLSASPMELLRLFVSRSGQLVTREEIAQLWSQPEAVDIAHGINTAVNRLRTALGDDPASPTYIETVVGKGYRFVAEVTAVEDLPEDVLPSAVQAERPTEDPAANSFIPAGLPIAPVSSSSPADEPANAGNPPLVLEEISEVSGSHISKPIGTGARRTGNPWPFGRTAEILVALSLLGVGACAAFWLRPWKGLPTAASATVPHKMLFTLATFNDSDERITAAAVSHRGRTVAYSDRFGVSIRPINAGFDHLLPSPPSFRVERITWYPEDTRLLVSGVQNPGEKAQVWVVSLQAEAPRLLLDDAGQAVASSDGSRVAFTRHGNAEVWVADNHGQNQRRLVPGAEGDNISSLLWVPQGDRLVFVRRRTSAQTPEENSPLAELQSQFQWEYESVNGSTGHLLAEERNIRFDSAYLLPDGRLFFPQNDYVQEHPLAHLSMIKTDLNSGRFLSDPQIIQEVNGDRAFSLSASDDGREVGMAVERRTPEVFIGELQRVGPALVNTRRLTHDASDAYPHGWTADGGAVIYESNDSGKYAIYRRNLDAPAPEMLARLADDSVLPEVTPDGKWVLFAQFPPPRVHANAIFRVSVNGGKPEQVPTAGAFDEFDCPASNRGTCVLRETVGKQFVYFALDALTGRGKELGRTDWMPNVLGDWGLSPDSSMVALANHDPVHPGIRVLTLSSPSGSMTANIPLSGYGIILKPTWSPDARGFYVESKTDIGYSLLYVDRAGHVKVLRDTPNPIWGVPTRDGAKLAFVDQSASKNVWVAQASTP
jgi:DNA-binding winged helix-turn-helix (wHTH) protein/Tol biopolymer transport system component